MFGRFIDLHSHTDESDGSFSPEELVLLAKKVGLDALAITDHDTFEGYKKAVPFAQRAGLDLVHGIELNTRFSSAASWGQPSSLRSVHLLAYFLSGPPTPVFENWLARQREERLSRNRKLADALQAQGLNITLEEVEARGKSLAGRPHFASLLVQKGYAKDFPDAFARYLGEDAPSYVVRESATTEEAIHLVRQGGGIPVAAHPIRLNLRPHQEREVLGLWKAAGLVGLEVYHSEHSAERQVYYRELAAEFDLLPSGGSDFHGTAKPNVELGSGMAGNVRVPREFLEGLRSFARSGIEAVS